MRERPIIMTGPSVRAILAGTKTQTRRVMKPQPKGVLNPWSDASEPGDVYIDGTVPVRCVESRGRNKRDAGELSLRPVPCPYGLPGDRLWVRETFAIETNMDIGPDYEPSFSDGRPIVWHEDEDYGRWWEQAHYRATEPTHDLVFETDGGEDDTGRWTPSIFMGRPFARIILEVTDVRVQRLQEISEDDAQAEGVVLTVSRDGRPLLCVSGSPTPSEFLPGKKASEWTDADLWRFEYARLWNSTNGKRAPWESNPFVWAISFKKLEDR